jgi:hypothetical protein
VRGLLEEEILFETRLEGQSDVQKISLQKEGEGIGEDWKMQGSVRKKIREARRK